MTLWGQNPPVENHCFRIFQTDIHQVWKEMLSGPKGSNGNLTKETYPYSLKHCSRITGEKKHKKEVESWRYEQFEFISCTNIFEI